MFIYDFKDIKNQYFGNEANGFLLLNISLSLKSQN